MGNCWTQQQHGLIIHVLPMHDLSKIQLVEKIKCPIDRDRTNSQNWKGWVITCDMYITFINAKSEKEMATTRKHSRFQMLRNLCMVHNIKWQQPISTFIWIQVGLIMGVNQLALCWHQIIHRVTVTDSHIPWPRVPRLQTVTHNDTDTQSSCWVGSNGPN